MHLAHDISAPYQLPFDEKLRVGGPLAKDLDLLPDHRVLQYIYVLILKYTCIRSALPYFFSTATTCPEYPHLGICGVPFMKSTMSKSLTHFLIIYWAFSFVIWTLVCFLKSSSEQKLLKPTRPAKRGKSTLKRPRAIIMIYIIIEKIFYWRILTRKTEIINQLRSGLAHLSVCF